MPPFPQRPQPGGRWVLLTLLIIALVVSLLVNIVQLGITLVAAAGDVRQTVISGEGSDKIAVVPIDGIIDDNSTQTFDTVLKRSGRGDRHSRWIGNRIR
jgi:hypothetical protein